MRIRQKLAKDGQHRAKETDCHTSDVGHWFAMTCLGRLGADSPGVSAEMEAVTRRAAEGVGPYGGDGHDCDDRIGVRAGPSLPRWGRNSVRLTSAPAAGKKKHTDGRITIRVRFSFPFSFRVDTIQSRLSAQAGIGTE